MATEYEVDRMVVRLTGDQSAYQKMIASVEKQTEEAANWAAKMGAKITDSFNTAFRTAQSALSSVASISQKSGAALTGVGAAVTAPLGKATLDFAEYGKGLQTIVRQTDDAAKSASALKKDLKDTSVAFKELSKVVELTEKQAAVYKLMSDRTGLSLKTLAETIKDGTEEYKKWEKEADKFGLVMTKEQVKAATDLSESWQRVKESIKGAWVQVGSIVSKGFKDWNDVIVGAVTSLTKWIKENKELIKTIAEVAAKLTAVGTVLMSVGTALGTISAFLGPITAAVLAGVAAWTAWDTATGKFLRQEGVNAWEKYKDSVVSTYQTIMDYGKRIVAFVDEVTTGVFNAIAAGNLKLAVEIAWGGAKVAWEKALTEIDKLTKERFSGIFQNLAAGNWRKAFEAAIAEIELLWKKMWLQIDPILTQLQNKMTDVWTVIVNKLDDAGVSILNVVGQIRAVFEDAAQNVIEKWTFVKTYFEGLGDFITGIWKRTFGGAVDIAAFTAKTLFGIFTTNLNQVLSIASGLLKLLAANVSSQLATIVVALQGVTGYAFDNAKFQTALTGLATGGSFGIGDALSLMNQASAGAENNLPKTTAQDVERTRAQGRNNRLEQRKAARTAEAEQAKTDREDALQQRELETLRQIADLEDKIAQLRKEGKEAAAEQLKKDQETLQTKIEQARAEKEAADKAAAVAEVTAAKAEAEKRAQEEKDRRDKEIEALEERFKDPAKRYEEQLDKINKLFKEGERDSRAYKEAVKAIQREFLSAKFNVEIHFGSTGMDAVIGNTKEWLDIVQSGTDALRSKEYLDRANKQVAENNEAKKKAAEEEQARSEEEVANIENDLDTWDQEGKFQSAKEVEDYIRQNAGEYSDEVLRIHQQSFLDEGKFATGSEHAIGTSIEDFQSKMDQWIARQEKERKEAPAGFEEYTDLRNKSPEPTWADIAEAEDVSDRRRAERRAQFTDQPVAQVASESKSVSDEDKRIEELTKQIVANTAKLAERSVVQLEPLGVAN